VGYLEELKRQADAALAQQTQDIGALQRNALLTDAACQTTSRYFGTLARQLNVLQPVSKAVWRFDSRTSFSQLRFTDFRADSRLKKLRDEEVFDHVVLSFAAKTGTRVTIAKDFPPEIEKLEARLRQCGAHYDSEVIRDPENGRFVEKRFELLADFQSSVRLLPDHDCRPRHLPHRQPRRFRDGERGLPGIRGRHRPPRRAGALDHGRAARLPARRPAPAPRRRLSRLGLGAATPAA
jgi:hypothetical protein